MTKVRVGGNSQVSQSGTLRMIGTYVTTFDPADGLPVIGSGKNQRILKGDFWRVSVAGTIPGLTPVSVLAEGDIVYAATNNATVAADFFAVAGVGVGNGSVTITALGATLQTAAADTPLDADTWNFYDAVDTVLKKVTWSNIKATLKTYFDTLYDAIGAAAAAQAASQPLDADLTAIAALTTTAYGRALLESTGLLEFIGIACSDETTVLSAASTSVPVATFHAPYAMTLTRVFSGLRTAGTGAAVVTVDIHINGTTIMSATKILFTAAQKLSADGTLTTTALAAGDYVEIFLDQRDTDNVATGLKTYLVGYK